MGGLHQAVCGAAGAGLVCRAELSLPQPPAAPDLNWVAAGVGELVLGLALVLGLWSRWAALGLLFITYVAVYTVHFDLGWAGWNQIDTEAGLGFKVPLMLGLMLLTICTQGGGQYALDAWRGRARRPHPRPA